MRLRRAAVISALRNGLLSQKMDETHHISPGSTRPRVLVVDDDPDIGMLLERYLGSRGLDVRVIQSARELARELHRRRFDILLLDLGLPDGDGLDALRELRRVWHGPLLIYSVEKLVFSNRMVIGSDLISRTGG
ncbi:MAG: response regulator [Pseudomonadota bacterium]